MSHEKAYNQLLIRIAKNIKRLRNARKLTQEEMIDFGFNYRHFQKLESGTYSPNLHTLSRLALVFRVDILDLLKKE